MPLPGGKEEVLKVKLKICADSKPTIHVPDPVESGIPKPEDSSHSVTLIMAVLH